MSQPTDVQDRTVATLAEAPFNKIRMCVFPKFYDFNIADPWAYAYPGTRETGFDCCTRMTSRTGAFPR